MGNVLSGLFGVSKPVIAMGHLPALPGTPHYDEKLGVEGIVEKLRKDVRALLDGGVDAILFCNEDDRPYSLRADFEGVAVMARAIAEVRPTDHPFGVDFLWDARAAMAIAVATGASFIREVLTGTYDSDMGLWVPNAAEVMRYRRHLHGTDIKVFFNITPEFAAPLGDRSVGAKAVTAVVACLADAILIAGDMAGSEPDLAVVQQVKEALVDRAPVLINTGATAENVAGYLKVADGVIVGSGLKVDGETWNPVDPTRVQVFVEAVREARAGTK